MGNNILYAILFLWVKIHALLPMPALFLLSDLFCFFIHRVARYRRRVVRKNLRNSFPDKTEKELRKLERRFYHHFADYIMETVKLAHLSQEELLRRANIRNPELIYELLDKGHTCFILMMGHYGNWEWFSGATARFEGRATIYQVYRPVNSKAFDRLLVYLRTRFHSCGIKKKDTIRDMIRLKQNKTPALIPFLADQTPSRANLHYWTRFLNQQSAFLTGPERIAKKLDLPVVFADTIKIKRGYYTIDLKLITDNAKETGQFRITEEYARMMEKTILRDPAFWLWTHKRWKYRAGFGGS